MNVYEGVGMYVSPYDNLWQYIIVYECNGGK